MEEIPAATKLEILRLLRNIKAGWETRTQIYMDGDDLSVLMPLLHSSNQAVLITLGKLPPSQETYDLLVSYLESVAPSIYNNIICSRVRTEQDMFQKMTHYHWRSGSHESSRQALRVVSRRLARYVVSHV
jgi:hypothetical protein